ncbi:MAG: S1 RNA-binding domain-containing protein [Candidatus Melainabacteria bacterium]|nr:S1 RNA-binding domain-containing protein [Candidatus Melainabacteria bacterium]
MTDKMAEFERLLKEGSYEFKVQQGDIVKGKIIFLEKDGALVDIGGKTEAFLPYKELTNKIRRVKIEELVKVGEEHDFYVLRDDETEEEKVILSLKKVNQAQGWNKLEEAKRANEILSGTIASFVKGGAIVELFGIKGFIPNSQLRIKNSQQESLLGSNINVKVLELDFKKNKLIFSQKLAIQDEKADLMEKTIQNLEVGQIISGEVVRVTDFGAFIDLGGIDGLLPISEFSWQRVHNPQDILKVGQEVQLKVLKIDRDVSGRVKISLSLKRMQSDPWNELRGKINDNEIIEGTVSKVASFGVFIEVHPGVEGLVPRSEITNESESPKTDDYLKVGDTVKVLVKRFAPNEHRLSLSIKDAKDANYQ